MENLLEQQRRLHEERERLENAMADEVLHKKQLVKSRSTITVLWFAYGWKQFLFTMQGL